MQSYVSKVFLSNKHAKLHICSHIFAYVGSPGDCGVEEPEGKRRKADGAVANDGGDRSSTETTETTGMTAVVGMDVEAVAVQVKIESKERPSESAAAAAAAAAFLSAGGPAGTIVPGAVNQEAARVASAKSAPHIPSATSSDLLGLSQGAMLDDNSIIELSGFGAAAAGAGSGSNGSSEEAAATAAAAHGANFMNIFDSPPEEAQEIRFPPYAGEGYLGGEEGYAEGMPYHYASSPYPPPSPQQYRISGDIGEEGLAAPLNPYAAARVKVSVA